MSTRIWRAGIFAALAIIASPASHSQTTEAITAADGTVGISGFVKRDDTSGFGNFIYTKTPAQLMQ